MHLDSAYHVTVASGLVYFGSSVDNRIYALDENSGQVRWTFFTGGPVRYAPTVAKDRVFAGSDDGHVYCLGAQDGKLLWKFRPGPSEEKLLGNGRIISVWPVRTSVLVDGEIAYCGAGVFPHDGIYICAVRVGDGSVIWKNDTVGDHSFELNYGGTTPQGYLLASKKSLYVPSGRAMPAVYDREDGKFLRFLPADGKTGGSWALLDQDQLIAGVDRAGAPVKVAFDGETGEKKGDAYAWFPGIDLVVTADVSYVLTDGGIVAINRTQYADTTAKAAETEALKRSLGTNFTDLRRKLRTADEATRESLLKQVEEVTARMQKVDQEIDKLKTTTLKWRFQHGGLNTFILAGETVFACGDKEVIGLDGRTGQKLWSAPVKGEALGCAAANGKVFVSTDKGPIYCFGSGGTVSPSPVKETIVSAPYANDARQSVCESAAERIVRETGVKKGYGLVLGCEEGRLAFELAKRTDLKLVVLEKNAGKVSRAREQLTKAGLYGSRVVVEPWDLSDLPDYFANLIVSEEMLMAGSISYSAEEMFRVLRPHGGIAYFGQPSGLPERTPVLPRNDLLAWAKSAAGPPPVVTDKDGFWVKLTRPGLVGEGTWTHLYGNPQNTASSQEQLIEGALGVLWYGEPGSQRMPERHARAAGPVSINGRLFIQGDEVVMGYDAYNGTELWQREIPGAVRVRVDVDGGNLSVNQDGLYVAAHDKCYRLDPATGATLQTFQVPPSEITEQPSATNPSADAARRWGYVAAVGDTLFGTTSVPLKAEYASLWKELAKDGKWELPKEMNKEFAEFYQMYFKSFLEKFPVPTQDAWAEMQRSGMFWRLMDQYPNWGSEKSPKLSLEQKMMVSDSLFAADVKSGGMKWVYRGQRIANTSPTFAEETVFLLEDSASPEQRQAALEAKRKLIQDKKYEEGSEASLSAEDADVRMVVALDAVTGKKRWERPLDITGCGGFRAGLAQHDGVLLCFGHFSNHDRELFRTGSLTWRRVTALDSRTGEVIWSKPLNYLRRPLILGDSILIEPRMCSLRTGEIRMRTHPITGEQTPWEFYRPGHGCSVTTASASHLFYRSYNTAYYDLKQDRGMSYFGALRSGCWVNFIAANGLLMIPESGSGCTCSFPLRTSVVMKTRNPKRGRDWTIYISQSPITPVKHFAINFGAPGDMRDDDGTIWFGYPRPNVAYGVKFNLNETLTPGMGFFARDFKGVKIEGTDKPWLFTSGCRGLQKCEIDLLGDAKEKQPGIYSLRLGFMAPEGDQPGQRMFDVKVQGQVVLKDFDVTQAAGAGRAVTKEIKGLKLENTLALELVPKAANPSEAQVPVLCYLQAIREDALVK